MCNVDSRLHSLVAFGSRYGHGKIVRLKPDLLRAFASARGREVVRNVTNEPNSAQVAGNA